MSNNIFDDLSKVLTPLRRKYELEMAKKHLKYLDRYRQRLAKKIKELEDEKKT